MIFVPKLINNYSISRYDVENIGRHYHIKLEDGSVYLYPSMTTLLSLMKSEETKDILSKWRKSIGDRHANAISKIATDDGEMLHYYCEQIMLQKYNEAKTYFKECTSKRAKFFMQKITPYLAKYKTIYASEEFMFSLKYGVAGTTDAIIYYDGKPTVLDFKTSKSVKNPNNIIDYYIQVSGYALFWEELTGQVINDGIILIVNPINVQEIAVDLRPYKQMFIDTVNEFYGKYGREYLSEVMKNEGIS